MKKKWLIWLMTCLTVILCAFAASGCDMLTAFMGGSAQQSAQAQAFTYKLNKDGTGYVVTGYEGEDVVIRIPDTYEGLPVTAVGQRAFYNNEKIEMVFTGQNVTIIEPNAFYGCTALKEVTLNDGLQKIGSSAFSNCTAMTSIALGKTLKTISGYAFYNCSSLTAIYIPPSVDVIEASVFHCCDKLTILCREIKGGWERYFYCGRPVRTGQ